ncbi:hypothetical protein MH215_10350 [Paenibacillus sp. ACRSA]|uniref:hypothetical protein n=1 Tax=Paenibacillus sp. ACRSA TaxID=2918211 RepID=UPI001EF6F38C|nr:hypothetical protein [Paenibacillus sp. ACRSA]MCG7377396.1 hypothetical protein [Paenibacillus sp. ACRSA]
MTDKQIKLASDLVSTITQHRERMGISFSPIAEQTAVMQRNVDLIFNDSTMAAIKDTQNAMDALRDSLLTMVDSKAFESITTLSDLIKDSFGDAFNTLANNTNFDSYKAIADSLSSIDYTITDEEIDYDSSTDISTNIFEEEAANIDKGLNKTIALKKFIALYIELVNGYKLYPSDDKIKYVLVALVSIIIHFSPDLMVLAVEKATSSDNNLEQKPLIEIAQKERELDQNDEKNKLLRMLLEEKED